MKKIKKVRNSFGQMPTEVDLNGISWAIVHLQDVYGLSIDDIAQGVIRQENKIKELDGKRCVV